jgi:hypothetical protein
MISKRQVDLVPDERHLLRSLFYMLQMSDDESCDDQKNGNHRHHNKSLSILRSIDLLPDNQRQPCLKDICHLIHAANRQRSLLIVVRADLLSPTGAIRLVIDLHRISYDFANRGRKKHIRHAEAAQPISSPHKDITEPFPSGRNIPDGKGGKTDNIGNLTSC